MIFVRTASSAQSVPTHAEVGAVFATAKRRARTALVGSVASVHKISTSATGPAATARSATSVSSVTPARVFVMGLIAINRTSVRVTANVAKGGGALGCARAALDTSSTQTTLAMHARPISTGPTVSCVDARPSAIRCVVVWESVTTPSLATAPAPAHLAAEATIVKVIAQRPS